MFCALNLEIGMNTGIPTISEFILEKREKVCASSIPW